MKHENGPLPANEPGAAHLAATARGLINMALEHIRNPAPERADDVHAVRVTIKRLRAILRLIRPVIPKDFFQHENEHLKKAARRLAFSRDATIARKTLATLSQSVSDARRREAFAAVEAGFKERTVSSEAIEKALAKTATDLEESARRLEHVEIDETGWEPVETGLRKVYNQARRRMADAFQNDDDLSYHRWRIRVKTLYHELQFLQPNISPRIGEAIPGLKKLESKLGANQDIAMLMTLLRKKPDTYGGEENVAEVMQYLNRKSKKLKRQGRQLGKEMFEKKKLRRAF